MNSDENVKPGKKKKNSPPTFLPCISIFRRMSEFLKKTCNMSLPPKHSLFCEKDSALQKTEEIQCWKCGNLFTHLANSTLTCNGKAICDSLNAKRFSYLYLDVRSSLDYYFF